MASDDLYRQVELTHEDGRVDVVWIPRRLAVRDRMLRVGDEQGWKVTALYAVAEINQIRDTVSQQRAYEDVLEPHR